jgi:cobalamin biosynthesis Mg chelatase CobN
MTDDDNLNRLSELNRPVILEAAEIETVPTTAADVESAGRSCMAIVVILALIVVVLALWLALRSIGVGT